MADYADSTRITYEAGNALGVLWQVAPRFAKAMVRRPNYSKIVLTYLRALDFYCMQHGIDPTKVRVETWVDGSRLVQRILG